MRTIPTTLLLLAIVLTAWASPSRRSGLNLLQKRSSYDCPRSVTPCTTCNTQENRCLGQASAVAYAEVRSCIAQAQECYFAAENVDIYGRYSCDYAHTTCLADGGDEPFCDKQLDACSKCETTYDKCRNCPDCINTSDCQQASLKCFNSAVTLNGTVTPGSSGDRAEI